MNILIINSYYYPDIIGGAEISVQKLAEILATNHNVSVVCTGSMFKDEVINNVHVYRLKRHEKRNKIIRSFNELFDFSVMLVDFSYDLCSALWTIVGEPNVP